MSGLNSPTWYRIGGEDDIQSSNQGGDPNSLDDSGIKYLVVPMENGSPDLIPSMDGKR